MSQNKKILHIVSGDLSGGAARGAYWLHKSLINKGVKSLMLTNSNSKIDDNTIHSTSNSKLVTFLKSKLDLVPFLLYPKRQKTVMSNAFFGVNIYKHPLYKWADIIHLHWINDSFINIKQFDYFKKPLVWTIRDMWPLTGGCHYSMDCNNFKNSCGYCIQLGSNKENDITRLNVKRKLKYFPKNIEIVTISNWLNHITKESTVFKGYNIRTINNGIDPQTFVPIDKETAKKELNISTDKKVILVGANNPNSYYKGFNNFLESLNYLDNKKYYLLFFGDFDNTLINDKGFEYKSLGFQTKSQKICLIYSSADVFVAPSIMEAFGKTIVESMSCETPVVCFDATGPKDIVIHKESGYKAKPFVSEDLANGINWICNNSNFELGKNSRERVVKYFNINTIASEYIKLYNEI
ncbi:MAG: glycosyltransferase family 4 protein [bacterium]